MSKNDCCFYLNKVVRLSILNAELLQIRQYFQIVILLFLSKVVSSATECRENVSFNKIDKHQIPSNLHICVCLIDQYIVKSGQLSSCSHEQNDVCTSGGGPRGKSSSLSLSLDHVHRHTPQTIQPEETKL